MRLVLFPVSSEEARWLCKLENEMKKEYLVEKIIGSRFYSVTVLALCELLHRNYCLYLLQLYANNEVLLCVGVWLLKTSLFYNQTFDNSRKGLGGRRLNVLPYSRSPEESFPI
jgi:hypothetical protein